MTVTTWFDEEKRKARAALAATDEGRRLIAQAEAALQRGVVRGGTSAWQKAFAESQAVLRAQLAADAKKGLVVLPLGEALSTHESLVRAHWPRFTDDLGQLFTLAFWQHGTLIHVPRGVCVETQISPWPAADFAGEVFSLQLVILEDGAQASVLSGCVQPKPALGDMRMGSWHVSVGAGATLEWLTLDHLAGVTDAAMRRFLVADTGRVDWRLLRLSDPGARFPLEHVGPVHWSGAIVPEEHASGGIVWQGVGPLRGEVLVFQSAARGYHIGAHDQEPPSWRVVSERDALIRSLKAFPMEYAIEAEMALETMI